MKFKFLFALVGLLFAVSVHAGQTCGGTGIGVQVLGSGGPESTDQRASSGYLVWQNGKARVLVDMGPGSMLRYEQSGARIEDLDVVLLTHLHVDHSADLPALIKAAFFTERKRDLPIYGPTGNAVMPDTVAFVQSMFAAPSGSFRYLAGYLSGEGGFKLIPMNVSAIGTAVQQVMEDQQFKISASPVHHGALPSLAWRIDIGGRSVAFSGDTSGEDSTLPNLAAGVDLLVAHNAAPQGADSSVRKLHMPPSVIGEIAVAAKTNQLVLSHRMKRTLGREAESKREIRKHFAGPVSFAEDGQCFKIPGR